MAASSRTHLSVLDGVLLIVGLIIGTSILRVPASIAQQTTGPQQLLGVVVLGALFALCGAYCYAQLSRRYPERGGEYAYLHQALGAPVSFLFIWARTAVLQTGSIAATVYIFGDYATKLVPLGPYSTVLYALLAVLGLSLLNAVGLRLGKAAQNLLTAGKIGGLLLISRCRGLACGLFHHMVKSFARHDGDGWPGSWEGAVRFARGWRAECGGVRASAGRAGGARAIDHGHGGGVRRQRRGGQRQPDFLRPHPDPG